MAGLVDIHAHFVPDGYRAALEATGHHQPDGFPHIPAWTAESHVELLDRVGIARAYLSISSPGVRLGDGVDPADLAGEVNEAGARARRDHPGRFGLLASLPLPDVDASLAEIDHAFDRLGADGVAVLTNVDGTYLGDPALEPVLAELDRRRARVLVHPTSPPCWEHTSRGRPRPMIEFLLDTTRAVVDLVLGGAVARHRNLAWIIPHAGAALPMVADRVAAFLAVLPDIDPTVDVERDLAALHYDLAGHALPRQLDALLTLAPADHLHYGSDHPFTPGPVVEAQAARILARTGPAGRGGGGLGSLLAANTDRLFGSDP